MSADEEEGREKGERCAERRKGEEKKGEEMSYHASICVGGATLLSNEYNETGVITSIYNNMFTT